MEHIKFYGEGNERRLTGHHETSPIAEFSLVLQIEVVLFAFLEIYTNVIINQDILKTDTV